LLAFKQFDKKFWEELIAYCNLIPHGLPRKKKKTGRGNTGTQTEPVA
jgi:hypothetical protein